MTPFDYGLWSIPILLALIFARLPIGLAMFLVGIAGTTLVTGTTAPVLGQLKSIVYSTFSNYSLSIVPLFLLMGQFATRGGMSRALFRAAEAMVGHRRGGVAMAAVAACGGFGAICGSSLATAATMGQVALPEMRRCGYSGALSTACLAAGGTLGILIPPSVVLVIYAILTEQNIAKLFVAAFIPGLLAAVGYMITVSLYVRLNPSSAGRRERASWTERTAALVAVWPVLVIFFAVIGGIYSGVFTPTEGAAVGAAGTGLMALVNGGLDRRGLIDSFLATASSTGMIFFIVLGAGVYNSFLAFSQLPQQAAAHVVGLGLDPWTVMVLILLCYLVFGCIMDSLSMILLTIPIFFPIVSALDYGLAPEDFALWFGIIVLIVVEVGLITPPVGMNLFVINAMAPDVPLGRTFRGVVPFIMSDIVRVAILTLFPGLTLALVHWLY